MTFKTTAWSSNERDVITLHGPIPIERLFEGYIQELGLHRVHKYTRVKRGGKASDGFRGAVIYCPHCEESETISHFRWKIHWCRNCHRKVAKEEWWTER